MRHPVVVSSALLAAAALAWLPAAGEAQSTTDKVKQKTESAKSTAKEMTKEVTADISDSWITSKTRSGPGMRYCRTRRWRWRRRTTS